MTDWSSANWTLKCSLTLVRFLYRRIVHKIQQTIWLIFFIVYIQCRINKHHPPKWPSESLTLALVKLGTVHIVYQNRTQHIIPPYVVVVVVIAWQWVFSSFMLGIRGNRTPFIRLIGCEGVQSTCMPYSCLYQFFFGYILYPFVHITHSGTGTQTLCVCVCVDRMSMWYMMGK